MIKEIREKLARVFLSNEPPVITELSTLFEISESYPHAFSLLERRFGVRVQPEDSSLTLEKFVEREGLPSSQIVFMEIQLANRLELIQKIDAKKANEMILSLPQIEVLDVRENWELKSGLLPKARPFSPEALDEILNSRKKDTPILLYCHFGVRSSDAASYLADKGFTQVFVLEGGIDAWSQVIDPKIRRYEGNWC